MILLSFAAIIALLSNVALAVPYGEFCEDDATCTEANNKCLKQSDCSNGWCGCGNGYDRVDNSCVTEKLLGHSCTTYCSVGTCTSGTCQCKTGLVASSDNRRCIGKALGEACTAEAYCEGSYTKCDGTCTCWPGYKKLDSNSCSYYDNGETCTLGTSVCPSRASCINTTSTSATCACNTVDGTKYEWWGDAKVCVHPGAVKNVGNGQTCIPGDYSSTGRLCAAGLVCQYCPTNSTSGDYKCFNGVGQIRASSLAIFTVLLLGIKIGLFTA